MSMPPTTTVARGFCTWLPMPVDKAMQDLAAKGHAVAYVGDVVGTGSSRTLCRADRIGRFSACRDPMQDGCCG